MFHTLRLGVARYLRSIDCITLVLVISLMCIGLLLIGSASPAMSYRIGSAHFYFLHRQALFVLLAIPVLIVVSSISSHQLIRISIFCFIIVVGLLIALLFVGEETKGSIRWFQLMSFSIQPSEFLKPTYLLIVAMVLAHYRNSIIKACFLIAGIHLVILALLLAQPDFGMAASISLITFIQFFVAGMPILLLIGLILSGAAVLYFAYSYIPHVHKRIESFLAPTNETSYQINKALEAHHNGGLFGRGIGEGTLKYLLPDSHTDFIFAVAGEELGALFCLILIGLFVFFVLRCMIKIYAEVEDCFNVYAATGAVGYIALQSILNIAVNLHLLPTKGMTLPFISYGGCSLLTSSICVGIYLNVCRRSNNRAFGSKIVHIRY